MSSHSHPMAVKPGPALCSPPRPPLACPPSCPLPPGLVSLQQPRPHSLHAAAGSHLPSPCPPPRLCLLSAPCPSPPLSGPLYLLAQGSCRASSRSSLTSIWPCHVRSSSRLRQSRDAHKAGWGHHWAMVPPAALSQPTAPPAACSQPTTPTAPRAACPRPPSRRRPLPLPVPGQVRGQSLTHTPRSGSRRAGSRGWHRHLSTGPAVQGPRADLWAQTGPR